MHVCACACACVCMSAKISKKLRTDFDEILETWAWPKEQSVRFWWRSVHPRFLYPYHDPDPGVFLKFFIRCCDFCR